MQCDPKEQPDGTWLCERCKWTGPRIFFKDCDYLPPTPGEIETKVEGEKIVYRVELTNKDLLIKTYETTPQKDRHCDLEDALRKLAICEKCVNYSQGVCQIHRGCDRRIKLMSYLRLKESKCEKWE